ncbi:MAG: hypothetical protein ACM3MA_03270, partial [Acidobacteriota bacterium]
KKQRGRLVVARLALLDRRRGSDYAFVLKWVLANPKNRSKMDFSATESPSRAAFSLVARSASHGFFRGEIWDCHALKAHDFLFVRAAKAATLRVPHRDILASGIQINRQDFYYLTTQIAVSHNSGFA